MLYIELKAGCRNIFFCAQPGTTQHNSFEFGEVLFKNDSIFQFNYFLLSNDFFLYKYLYIYISMYISIVVKTPLVNSTNLSLSYLTLMSSLRYMSHTSTLVKRRTLRIYTFARYPWKCILSYLPSFYFLYTTGDYLKTAWSIYKSKLFFRRQTHFGSRSSNYVSHALVLTMVLYLVTGKTGSTFFGNNFDEKKTSKTLNRLWGAFSARWYTNCTALCTIVP